MKRPRTRSRHSFYLCLKRMAYAERAQFVYSASAYVENDTGSPIPFVRWRKKTTLSSGTANNARVNAFFVICTTDQQFERRFTSHAFMVLPLQPVCAQFTDARINRELYFRLCCVFVVWSMAGEADDLCAIESTSWPATYLLSLSTLDAQMLMICTQEHLILFFGVSFSLRCITRSFFGIVGDASVETDRPHIVSISSRFGGGKIKHAPAIKMRN